uniref:CASP-like protein n=1 Tax=Haemonchus placei TaxID=6290 RepID=A0A0N4VZE2_HAEPC
LQVWPAAAAVCDTLRCIFIVTEKFSKYSNMQQKGLIGGFHLISQT